LLLPLTGAVVAAAIVLVQGFGEPFSFWGDKAVEETAVQQAMRFQRGYGAHSNYGFFHPGPVMFYLLGPLYRLMGNEPLALSVGALALNALAGLGVIVVVDRLLGRFAAVAATFSVALYFWSGPGVWEHWNPALVPLPLLLAGILWVGAWNGSWRWLLAGCLPASFVVQTHLSSLPLVLAAFAVGVFGLLLRAWLIRRRKSPEPRAHRGLPKVTVALVAALFIMWAPPLWQQVSAPAGEGNLGRVAAVVQSGPELPPGAPGGWPLDRAWRAVANEATRVPFGWTPAPAPTLPVDLGQSRVHVVRQLLWLGSLGFAVATIAWGAWARHWVVVGLGSLTVGMSVAAVFAAARVPGELFNYQLWGAAVSLVPTWVAMGAIVGGWVRERHAGVALYAGAAIAIAPVVAFVTDLDVPTPEPFGEQALAVSAFVRQELGDASSAAIAWDPTLDASATGVVATLRREGLDARVAANRSFVFGESLTADGEEARRLFLAPSSAEPSAVAALQPSWTCSLTIVGEVAGVVVRSSPQRC
jgi:hypothetical protein